MKKQLFASLKLAVLTALLAGCQSDQDDNSYLPGVKPASGMNMTTLKTSGLSAVDHISLGKNLKERLRIVSSKQGRNEYNLITADAELKNIFSGSWSWLTGNDPYYVAYRTNWFISADSEQEVPTNKWKIKKVEPGETFSISTIAPNTDCVDYLIDVKLIKEGTPLFNLLTGKAQPEVFTPQSAVKLENQPANYLAGDKKAKDSSTEPAVGQPTIPQPVVAPESIKK